jgi:hypothetical protein
VPGNIIEIEAEFYDASLPYLASTGRDCEIDRSNLVLDGKWEFLYLQGHIYKGHPEGWPVRVLASLSMIDQLRLNEATLTGQVQISHP